ncbi:MAG: hypothetical protein ABJ246_11690, partial [Paracoccaceae bacterium]
MIVHLDPDTASKLTPLRLPYMDGKARAAFQAFQDTGYTGDEWMALFARARGCVPHPCDWFPTGITRHSDMVPIYDLYQPGIDELAELGIRYAGLPRYHCGVTVTKDNWHRHGAPKDSFANMLRRDRRTALELLDALDTLEWEGTKCAVIACLGQHWLDTPWLERLGREGTAKVQEAAAKVLEKMVGEATEEQVAASVAKHFAFRDGALTESELYDPDKVMRLVKKARLSIVAREFGLTPTAFANDISAQKNDLWVFAECIGATGDNEARSRFAQRMLEHGSAAAAALYRDVSPELWEFAAQRSFSPQFLLSIVNFFGYGTLSYQQISENF